MAVTYREFSTTGASLFSDDHSVTPSVWGFIQENLDEWLGEICNPTLDLGNITTGSGYGADAVYTDVDLVRAATTQRGGKNMKATLTVTGGGISNVEITTKGNGFKAGDSLIAPDLAQLGGTGSGFQVPVASGDASIGMVKGIYDRTNTTSYPVGFQIGTDRTTTYERGYFINKTSSSSTTYLYSFYQSDPTTSNNGYGTYSNQSNVSESTWYNTNGDGSTVLVCWCADPGNRFFFSSDDRYNEGWGMAEVNRDPARSYPPIEVASRWVNINCPSNNTQQYFNSDFYFSTTYTGQNLYSLPLPADTGVLFNNFSPFGRAWEGGTYPDRIYTHSSTGKNFGHIYQNGVDTYRRITNTLYVRTSA